MECAYDWGVMVGISGVGEGEKGEYHVDASGQLVPATYTSKRTVCVDLAALRSALLSEASEISLDSLKVEEKWAFFNGMFTAKGQISKKGEYRVGPVATFSFPTAALRTLFYEFSGIVADGEEGLTSRYEGINALDLLFPMYHVSEVGSAYFRKLYELWCDPIATVSFSLVDEQAIPPMKGRASDIGYDLSIISKKKDFNGVTSLYDTGIKVEPSFGYYVEIVPRSSLSKSGYMLANSVGIIDPSYRGNLYIALTKVDPEAAEISFPFRCCQLIVRKVIHSRMKRVAEEMLHATERGEGGFGSTGQDAKRIKQ